MPIRLNLLAEAQEAKFTALRDPVRKTMPVAAFLLALVLLQMLEIQCNIWFERKDLERIDHRLRSIKANFAAINNNAVKDIDVERRLKALDQWSTNRFLWAPVLFALRQSATDDVRVTRLKGEQVSTKVQERKIGRGAKQKIIPGAMVERVSLYIDAKDASPGHENCLKFKHALGQSDCFVERLGRRDGFVLDELLRPAPESPTATNHMVVTFALAAHFPEVRR
jgi:hypothetical protein